MKFGEKAALSIKLIAFSGLFCYLLFFLFNLKFTYFDLGVFSDLYRQGNEVYHIASTTVFYSVLLILTCILTLMFGPSFKTILIKLMLDRYLWGLFEGFAAGLVCCLLIGVIIITFFNVHIQMYMFRSPAIYSAISYLVAYIVVVSVFEELIFRGIILNIMVSKLPIGWSVFLSSVLFALSHKYDTLVSSSLLIRLVIGVICALFYIWSQSIWASVAFHWTWDLFTEIMFGAQPTRPELLTIAGNTENEVALIILSVLVFYLILKWAFRNKFRLGTDRSQSGSLEFQE